MISVLVITTKWEGVGGIDGLLKKVKASTHREVEIF
jgi:hypothetical protein